MGDLPIPLLYDGESPTSSAIYYALAEGALPAMPQPPIEQGLSPAHQADGSPKTKRARVVGELVQRASGAMADAAAPGAIEALADEMGAASIEAEEGSNKDDFTYDYYVPRRASDLPFDPSMLDPSALCQVVLAGTAVQFASDDDGSDEEQQWDDEDSNAEDHYRNDYPDEEDDDDEYAAAARRTRGCAYERSWQHSDSSASSTDSDAW